jgi:hypothetical protein
MTHFNIDNSKIDQLNSTGDNIKQTTHSGDNAVSDSGNVVHTKGTGNTVQVDRPKNSLWSSIGTGLKWIWSKMKSMGSSWLDTS